MASHFKVSGQFNGARTATVTIDRELGLITVRPYKRRKTYELPLAWAAETIIWHVIKVEAAEKRAAKKAARRGRR